MGKIFGIADLPVSTIMTALEETRVPKPVVRNLQRTTYKARILNNTTEKDVSVSKVQASKTSNPVLKLRNGFGKLMKHFSKINPKNTCK